MNGLSDAEPFCYHNEVKKKHGFRKKMQSSHRMRIRITNTLSFFTLHRQLRKQNNSIHLANILMAQPCRSSLTRYSTTYKEVLRRSFLGTTGLLERDLRGLGVDERSNFWWCHGKLVCYPHWRKHLCCWSKHGAGIPKGGPNVNFPLGLLTNSKFFCWGPEASIISWLIPSPLTTVGAGGLN